MSLAFECMRGFLLSELFYLSRVLRVELEGMWYDLIIITNFQIFLCVIVIAFTWLLLPHYSIYRHNKLIMYDSVGLFDSRKYSRPFKEGSWLQLYLFKSFMTSSLHIDISPAITPAHSFDSHRNQRHRSASLRSTQWDHLSDRFLREFRSIAFWFSVDFLVPVQRSLAKWALTSHIILVWESAKFTPCRDSISFWCWISPM